MILFNVSNAIIQINDINHMVVRVVKAYVWTPTQLGLLLNKNNRRPMGRYRLVVGGDKHPPYISTTNHNGVFSVRGKVTRPIIFFRPLNTMGYWTGGVVVSRPNIFRLLNTMGYCKEGTNVFVSELKSINLIFVKMWASVVFAWMCTCSVMMSVVFFIFSPHCYTCNSILVML